MNLTHVFKFHFQFEYWTLASDLNGVTTYAKAYDGVGMLLPQSGSISLITKEQMAIPMQVRNIRDRSGAVVTKVGNEQYPMYVHSADPQLDVYSNVVAWKHTLRREPPRDYRDLVETVLAGV